MHMKYLILLLFLSSCAYFQSAPKLSDTANETAGWIYSPYDACYEIQELCASGEGKTFNEASASARANLASIFEVKIQSTLSVNSSGQNFPWQGEVKEEVQKSLEETVDQVLETVQIKKSFRKEGLSYALASLDRAKASELLRNRLTKIDQELETLWRVQQRTNMRRIVKLYMEREKLNEKYSIAKGEGKPSKISWEDIVRWRESRPKAEPLVLKIGQAPEWLQEKISELLTESGFRLVNGEAKKVVTVQVDSIREFLNVEGFEKYTFTLNMTSIENGQKNKTISASETVTGRTQADALLKVKGFFNNYIEHHLSDLHLD